ncbi:hypothetical protein BJ973_003497 [Actinoplanes tereljensis]|uniref:Uncharacterized protein n=1 Tax=Paractinoplanes tereljensis TaxID=571912 RepID=A0A919TZT9_9ACTN|nr:hypothetical protein [Actinoplanes tereljensis]GIF26227.1 hypothetical protein Ate02nite_89570 [Actinoplanes tereljensis]
MLDITSGGTPGPQIADELLLLDNNVYGSVADAPPLQDIAESFVLKGWRARRSSWTDFEVECEWVRIELQQTSDGVLFSGIVDPARLDDLGAVLTAFDLRFSMELWSTDRTELLRELRS